MTLWRWKEGGGTVVWKGVGNSSGEIFPLRVLGERVTRAATFYEVFMLWYHACTVHMH